MFKKRSVYSSPKSVSLKEWYIANQCNNEGGQGGWRERVETAKIRYKSVRKVFSSRDFNPAQRDVILLSWSCSRQNLEGTRTLVVKIVKLTTYFLTSCGQIGNH